MVVGGQDQHGQVDKGYAISLKSAVAVPSCLESICDYPNYVYSPISAIFDDGLPTVCGGRKGIPTTEYFSECYKFNYSNAWQAAGTRNYKSVHVGFSYVPNWGLVESGGYCNKCNYLDNGVLDHGLKSLEFSKDGETWETLSTQIPGQQSSVLPPDSLIMKHNTVLYRAQRNIWSLPGDIGF